MFVIKLGYYSVILELPWLRRHNVHIGFARNTLTFDSEFCLHHSCMHGNAIMIRGISIPTPENPNIAIVAGSTFTKLAKKKQHFALMIYAIDQALHAYKVRDRGHHTAIYAVVPSELRTDLSPAIAAVVADAATAATAIEDNKI